jgi:hypothetical protein
VEQMTDHRPGRQAVLVGDRLQDRRLPRWEKKGNFHYVFLQEKRAWFLGVK